MTAFWRVIGCLPAFMLGVSVWALTTPVLWGPADLEDQAPSSLTLRWSPVSGATRYRVALTGGRGRGEFTTSSAKYPLSDLPVSSAYSWCVRAENARGAGAWSPARRFTTRRPVLPGELVLCAAESGASILYLLNADGSNLRRLSPPFAASHSFTTPGGRQMTTTMDYAPAFNPDGSKIVFCSTRDGSAALYLMNVDGSGVTMLTHQAQMCALPRFTPDGKRIVFLYGDTTKQLAMINPDSSGAACLGSQAIGEVRHFTINPDSHHVAFITAPRASGAQGMLYLADLDDGKVTKLADGADPDGDLEFSADGTRVAYTCLAEDAVTTIAVKAVDAGTSALLHAGTLKALHTPAFTRDDTRIFFLCDEKNHALYSMPVEGGTLIHYADSVCHPVIFNPDGRYFVYTVARTKTVDALYISDVTGQHRYRLTDQRWRLTSFDWGPGEEAPSAPASPPDFQDTFYMAVRFGIEGLRN